MTATSRARPCAACLVELLRLARQPSAALDAARTTRIGASAAGGAALGAASSLSTLGLAATSAYLLARAAGRPPALSLTVALGAVQLFALAKAAARYGGRLADHDLALRLLTRLRVATFRALGPLVPAGLGDTRSGDLLGRVVDDVDALQRLYIAIASPALSSLVAAAAAVAAASLFDLPAGLALAGGLAVCGVVLPVLSAAAGATDTAEQVGERGELSAFVVEALAGAAELASWGRSDEALGRLALLDSRLATRARRAARRRGLVEAARLVGSSATILAVLWIGLHAARSGRIGGVTVALLVGLALGATELVGELPGACSSLGEGLEAARRVLEVLRRPPLVAEPRSPQAVPKRGSSPPALEVSDASVRYGPDGPYVLEGIDLCLRPGSRVGLVGPSGAGKSTLAHVLVRFLDPERGTVSLEGLDLRRVGGKQVRRLVGALDQEAYLFATTIRENLRLANPDAPTEALLEALEAVGLGRLVASLPRGLDTDVGELGASLSGGERRRLTLARLVLADRRVLVLDEPTADLDPATAEQLLADLGPVLAGRSVLLVTHRPGDLVLVDSVLRLEDGRLAESRPAGFHTALHEHPGGPSCATEGTSLRNRELNAQGHA